MDITTIIDKEKHIPTYFCLAWKRFRKKSPASIVSNGALFYFIVFSWHRTLQFGWVRANLCLNRRHKSLLFLRCNVQRCVYDA